jgi:hypothetical protein
MAVPPVPPPVPPLDDVPPDDDPPPLPFDRPPTPGDAVVPSSELHPTTVASATSAAPTTAEDLEPNFPYQCYRAA